MSVFVSSGNQDAESLEAGVGGTRCEVGDSTKFTNQIKDAPGTHVPHGVAMFDMDETITKISLGDTLDDHWWADEQLRNEGKLIRQKFLPFGDEVPHLPFGPARNTKRRPLPASWKDWGDGTAYSEVNNKMRLKYLTVETFEAIKNLVFTGKHYDSQRPDECLSVKTEAEAQIKALADLFKTLKKTHRLVVISINGTAVTKYFIEQVFPGVFDEVLGWEDLADTTTDAVEKKVLKIQEVVYRYEQELGSSGHRHIFVDDSPGYMEPVATACNVQPILVRTDRVGCPVVPAFEENSKSGERWSGAFSGEKIKTGGLAADPSLVDAILAHVADATTPGYFDERTGELRLWRTSTGCAPSLP